MKKHLWIACISIVAAAGTYARAEWKAPKDNLITEKQLINSIEIMNQWWVDLKAADAAVKGQSSLVAAATIGRVSDKMKANITAHGMTEPEFNWIRERSNEAWAGVVLNDQVVKMKEQGAAQLKANQTRIAEAQTKLAAYQTAQKNGRRVMTAEERKGVIDGATEEQKGALEEANQHKGEVAQAQADISKYEADQKTAELALKNPPKFENDDEKKAFVDEKNGNIESAKNAKKDASERLAEVQKAEAASRAKAAQAAARIKDPDVPTTDEDKAAVKQQNEENIKQLTEEIKSINDGNKLMQEGIDQNAKALSNGPNAPPPANVELLKKHRTDFEASLGMKR